MTSRMGGLTHRHGGLRVIMSRERRRRRSHILAVVVTAALAIVAAGVAGVATLVLR